MPILGSVWREEPWGFPTRSPEATSSLKFSLGVKDGYEAFTYRLVLALYWTAWVILAALGPPGEKVAGGRILHVSEADLIGAAASPVKDDQGLRFLLYVSDWAAVVLGLYLWAAFLAVCVPERPAVDKLAWIFHDASGMVITCRCEGFGGIGAAAQDHMAAQTFVGATPGKHSDRLHHKQPDQ
jgi:hypothetical protein